MLIRNSLAACALALTLASPAAAQGIVNGGGGGSASPTLSGDCTATTGGVLSCNAPHPGYVNGNWYLFGPHVVAQAGAAQTIGMIVCSAGYASRAVTISSLGVDVTTLAAGGNLQLAIYQNLNGLPSTLIGNTGNISVAAAGTLSGALGANAQIGPGSTNGRSVWFCANSDNATVVAQAVSPATDPGRYLQGSATMLRVFATASGIVGLSCTGAACAGGSSTFGTWPATLVGTTWSDVATGTIPILSFLVVSSP